MIARHATEPDSPAILALYRALAGETPVGSATNLRAVLAHPGTEILVVEDADIVVSMATLSLIPNVTHQGRPYGVIENVVTLPTHQRRGFGRVVMQAAIDTAWQANAYKVMLMTGRANSTKGFYEALGFDSTEKWSMILRHP